MSISRRSFLQGVGIGCSACALGAFPPGALARWALFRPGRWRATQLPALTVKPR
ncbi:twin-arginine translocation signal domain-containing protein [Salmonella enterica]|nr:twin-arginine translocation signal domain-containing protein [Salmonella enterica]EEN5683626.1 twin-arginine translocation signal domain-containing protein [Salmonella enterica]